jgi:hypothetical protein
VAKLELNAFNHDFIEDNTTWDGNARACCARAEGRLIGHGNLEVEVRLKLAIGCRNKRLGREKLPSTCPRRSIEAPYQ